MLCFAGISTIDFFSVGCASLRWIQDTCDHPEICGKFEKDCFSVVNNGRKEKMKNTAIEFFKGYEFSWALEIGDLKKETVMLHP